MSLSSTLVSTLAADQSATRTTPDSSNMKRTAGISVPSTTQGSTWTRGIVTSLWNFFAEPSESESEADVLEAWVGVRKGRKRCQSVGEMR
ncbi:hypothetical protein N7540_007516 [Penicillium herquei]|nr:hypothetical protein N7540_007516 [Penicillium herquei]